MEYWSSSLISLLFIGILLFVGKILKSKVKLLSKIVMPTALLGGMIGLLFSSVVIPGSYTLDVPALTAIVYHALAIGFLALSLKRSEHQNKRKLWSTGMVITSTYALQGFIGILLVMIFWKDYFVGSGMLLALGFGQGPGLAISFGNMWNNMLGGQGGALGASYAFLGFLWGGIIGVIAINVMSRRKGLEKPKTYTPDDSVETTTVQIDTVKEVSVLDGLTIQLVIIAIIYAAVWGTLFLLEKVLVPLGNIGNTIFGLLKGFNFIIAILYALVYKVILRAVEKRQKKDIKFLTNNYLLSNISSTCFNVMIAGSVLTITVDFLVEYGWLLLVISTVGGIFTLFYTRFITKRVYSQYQNEYFIGLYGMLTGVASTGIALLKGLDRNLETPVAEELVLGSGTAISMALPLFAFLMVPSIGFGTGNEMLMNLIALFGCLAYVMVMVIILLIRSRKNPK
ncbi:MAG TPA: sodium/glutamate symporter [Candidatus Izemoplasmatales bacterium]|nr:sodium/glutamate symporter [Bacillota bacterium]HRY77149.1 sodium/glutamate symporter [Candidatus Izemoplasmatales bacterium]